MGAGQGEVPFVRKTSILLRILCSLIDLLVLLVPMQLVVLGVFGVQPMQASYLFLLLYAVYGTLCCEIAGGMTLGKYCGKMCVLDRDGTKPSLMYLGLRELTKAMYLQPLAGPVLMLVSLGLYLARGVTLHDLISRTRVVYLGQAKRIRAEMEEQYERER